MKELFSVISIIFIVAGFWFYSKETKNKKIKPNLIVLFSWIITAIVNSITYIIIVQDIFKALLLISSVIANIIVTTITINNKNYIFLKRDILIITVLILILATIIISLNVNDIHLIIQIIATIPFIPLIIGILKKDGIEPFFPWLLMFISVIFNLLAVLFEYSNYWSLINPVRSAIFQLMVLIAIKIKSSGIWSFFLLKNK